MKNGKLIINYEARYKAECLVLRRVESQLYIYINTHILYAYTRVLEEWILRQYRLFSVAEADKFIFKILQTFRVSLLSIVSYLFARLLPETKSILKHVK